MQRIKSSNMAEQFVASELMKSYEEISQALASRSAGCSAMYIALRQALDKLNREWPRLEYLHFSRKALSYLERSILMKNVDIFWNPKQMDKRDSPDIQISTETGHVILVAELLHHSKKNEKGYLSEIKRKLKKLRRTGAKRVMLFFRAENYDAEVGKFLQQETEVDVVKLDLSEE